MSNNHKTDLGSNAPAPNKLEATAVQACAVTRPEITIALDEKRDIGSLSPPHSPRHGYPSN